MEIQSIGTSASGGLNTAAASVSPNSLSDSFLQLLVAQLKNQDPLKPQDGSAFMAELVQLTTLQERVKVRTLLEDGAAGAAAAAGSAALNTEGVPAR